ncbi:peptidoglycan D,D-transpeptidase FtsI family protein [Luteococcus sp.]|uniref:peptidoglycan D,D-transpeptidase FtsI family protein n=1 Tax=Luteococcus sp. TaxID=1969402 RepID=UPI0037352501
MASQHRRRPTAARRSGARLQMADPTLRLRRLLVLVLLLLGLCMGRALQLQALDSQAYASKAAAQMTHTVPLAPQRGSISDRFGVVMADTLPSVKIVADPSMLARNGVDGRVELTPRQRAIGQAAPEAVAAVLAQHLGGTPADYLPALTAKGKDGTLLQYKVVVPQVDTAVWNKISKQLRKGGSVEGHKVPYWYGLYKEDHPRRIYPSGSVGGNLVGMVRGDGTAVTGLEKYLDEELTGVPGVETFESSAYGRIPLGTDVLTPAVDGYDYQLTIDSTIQQAAEAALAKGAMGAAATTGTAIVMNVKTGEVLANANVPSYDPNKISEVAARNSMMNRSVEAIYEPGSVQKVLTLAALADMGLVKADTRVLVPPKLASGGGYIRDSSVHGTVPMTARGIMARSSNIGTTMLARQADKADLVAYLKKFGLGERTGLELPGEQVGLVPKADMPDYTRDQIAFGQGLSATPIQEAAAVAGIVNGGVHNPPTLIKQATTSEGEQVQLPAREPRRVISKEASAEVRDMMESVITVAPEKRAIPGYRAIGKSGTAERADGKGGYDGYTASFVLAAPADNPQILVYTVLDEPLRGHQGSEVAMPIAQEIMKLALPRYGVLPDPTPAPDKPLEYEP